MTDLLTKEERDAINELKGILATNSKWHFSAGEWIRISETLLSCIDNLSKRGVKKYSKQELYEIWVKSQDVNGYGVPETLEWCARFLGALGEK